MDGRPTWTDRDEAGDYVVPNTLSPRDLVFRPDNMDETVPHTHMKLKTGFSQKARDHYQPNFVCKLFHMRKIQLNGMMLGT